MSIFSYLLDCHRKVVIVDGRKFKIDAWTTPRGFVNASAEVLEPQTAEESKFSFIDLLQSESERVFLIHAACMKLAARR